MKLRFSNAAQRNLEWFKRYHEINFPEGALKAAASYRHSKVSPRAFPMIGRESSTEGVRELVVPKTPFAIVYRINKDSIDILHVFDMRSLRPENWSEDE